jgi:U3 small nucleolar RNA-associated protein 23
MSWEVITQCSMRHLYDHHDEPEAVAAIELAQSFERRRCGHHPSSYAHPLSSLECISSVVGISNRSRYVIATQNWDVRHALRAVPGVPLIYINRSVMIMEPMSGATAYVRAREERAKFRSQLKGPETTQDVEMAGERKEKRKKYGSKEPNPLSIKKSKKLTGSK